ncbi:MAG: class I SAM-dependent methyltransferase [Spirochaetales bacterium]|nr:class I SAM-dependent methyltransferase [Spirochaetales bacterium]
MLIEDYENWFKNPDFWVKYRPLMFDPDRMEDTGIDVSGLIKLAGLKDEMDILDLCCGEGRHSLEFARRGFHVTGIDITEPYLEQAEKSAKDEELDITFLRRDVREYVQEDGFDFAMNYFSSFGYFDDPEDDLLFCSNTCRSLKAGGSFLIDTIGKETAALHFKETEWFERDGYCIMLEYSITDGWTHIENRWLFISADHENPGILHETKFKHRLYSAVEMAELLTKAGFSEVRFFGGLDGRPYDHKAKRMLTLAIK